MLLVSGVPLGVMLSHRNIASAVAARCIQVTLPPSFLPFPASCCNSPHNCAVSTSNSLQGLKVHEDDIYISYQSMYHVHEIVNHVWSHFHPFISPIFDVIDYVFQQCMIAYGAKIGFTCGKMSELLVNLQALKPTVLALYPYLLNVLYEEVSY